MRTFSNICEILFDNCDYSVLVTDYQLDKPGPFILYVNNKFEKNTGYSSTEVIGQTPRILQGKKTERSVLNKLKEDLKNSKTFNGYTINYHKDGTEIFLDWSIITMIIDGVSYYVGIQKITPEQDVISWINAIKTTQEKILKDIENVEFVC